MSFITPKVQRLIHQKPPHRGFAFKVTETDEGIFLLVKLEELANYSQGQQEDISAWMAGICNSIRTLRIPCYIMEWK
jgi:hypothetical protein